jgi:membrane-associated phospholipid phosphatase
VPVDPAVFSMFLGVIISVLCALVINRFWKISAHMLAIGGLIGVMIGLSKDIPHAMPIILAALIFIAGAIGFSRLYLRAHSHGQVYVGFSLGLILNYLLVFYKVVI